MKFVRQLISEKQRWVHQQPGGSSRPAQAQHSPIQSGQHTSHSGPSTPDNHNNHSSLLLNRVNSHQTH